MEKKTPPRLTRSSPSCAHLKRYSKGSIAELPLPLSTGAPTDSNKFEHFVLALFSRMKGSIWYHIIPNEPNDVLDMSTSMGQRWDLVLPLLSNAGYLLFVKSVLTIKVSKWNNLRLLLEGDNMIQICSYRPMGGGKNMVCLQRHTKIYFTITATQKCYSGNFCA